ncbi:hypothetical protein [Hanstruepera flava]|uniref:hypothetical protein n=1 Tax=Hanstruepera flava TaxID=2930218 RepID=UPI0020278555|nr:hypothetical protein [Hanstruepera flava]
MWKYVLAWFPMVIVAIANGLFREKILTNYFKELQAHQVSTLSFILLMGVYVWGLFKLLQPISLTQTIYIGVLWLILTIVFEFLFGHFVAGHSWDRLLQDYNIFKGRLWLLALIWVTICPYIIYKIQN